LPKEGGNRQIQQAAVALLDAVLFRGIALNKTLPDASAGLSVGDEGSLKVLVYGSLRLYPRLKRQLKEYLKSNPKNKRVFLLLIVALYQLGEMRVAPYAVVNEAVYITPEPYKKLMNAVLRRFLRSGAQLVLQRASDSPLPPWWLEKINLSYGDKATDILKAFQSHPPLTLRINRRKSTRENYLAILQEEGIEAEISGPWAIEIKKPQRIDTLPFFQEGYFSVQDLGAQEIIDTWSIKTGSRVLDACAAPGGKTTAILEKVDCFLTAVDIDQKRAAFIKDNLARLGLSAQVITEDAANLALEEFDYILADVPCTASGVVKRHPDIPYLRQQGDARRIAQNNVPLLDGLWRKLKKGGQMLYATCSLFKEENDEQIHFFLQRHSDVALKKSATLLPTDKRDGFYYALLEKD